MVTCALVQLWSKSFPEVCIFLMSSHAHSLMTCCTEWYETIKLNAVVEVVTSLLETCQLHNITSPVPAKGKNPSPGTCQDHHQPLWCIHTSLSITVAGISLGMCPANERCHYNVTTSLIGWVHTKTDPCCCWSGLWFITYVSSSHYPN